MSVAFHWRVTCECLCLWRFKTRRLQRELCHSDARREEAETKAAQMEEKVLRLTDAASQVEETRKENEGLINQVFKQTNLKNMT